jgi:hypothetical protein
MRRFSNILNGIANDLGGRKELTTGEFQLARRAAYISMYCELMEMKETIEAPDMATYGTLTSHLARTLKLLGLKRVAKDSMQTLRGYIETAPIQPDDED